MLRMVPPLILTLLMGCGVMGCGGVSSDLESIIEDTALVLDVEDGVSGKTGDVMLQMTWGHDASGCIAPHGGLIAQLGAEQLTRGADDPCLRVTMTTALWATPAEASLVDLTLDDGTTEATMTIEHLAPPLTLQSDRTQVASGDTLALTLRGPPAERFRAGVITGRRADDGSLLDVEVALTAPADTIDIQLPASAPPGSYRLRADTSWSALFWNCPFRSCDGVREATAEVVVEVTGD